MSNELRESKKAPKKGTSTLQMALLLFIIGAVTGVAGSAPLAWIFLLGAAACAVVGLIQKDSAPR